MNSTQHLRRCRYTFELSNDPWFPKVPTAPGFPLQPCVISDASVAIVCGKRLPLLVAAAGGTKYPLSGCDRYPLHFLKGPVSASPNHRSRPASTALGLGRRRALQLASAQRSRASLIRGTRLHGIIPCAWRARGTWSIWT